MIRLFSLSAFAAPGLQGGQHHRKAFRLEQALDKMFGDKAVQLVHRDRVTLAGGLTLSGAGQADVIAMNCGSMMSRCEASSRLPQVAHTASPCEKNGSGGEPRSHNSRAPSSKLRLNLLEKVWLDDSRNGYLDDLSIRLSLPSSRGCHVELPLA